MWNQIYILTCKYLFIGTRLLRRRDVFQSIQNRCLSLIRGKNFLVEPFPRFLWTGLYLVKDDARKIFKLSVIILRNFFLITKKQRQTEKFLYVSKVCKTTTTKTFVISRIARHNKQVEGNPMPFQSPSKGSLMTHFCVTSLQHLIRFLYWGCQTSCQTVVEGYGPWLVRLGTMTVYTGFVHRGEKKKKKNDNRTKQNGTRCY